MKDPRVEVFDTETLQADVMRFLAIIAFCLIAILALVEKLPEQEEPVAEFVQPVQAQDVIEQKKEIPIDPVITEVERPTPVMESARLSLRFESDASFLRLIHEGEIVLFIKVGGGFKEMDASFRFSDVKLSGDLYEVMSESLPEKIQRITGRQGDAELFLVRLPEQTSIDIQNLGSAHAKDGGVLIIDARGGVTHEV